MRQQAKRLLAISRSVFFYYSLMSPRLKLATKDQVSLAISGFQPNETSPTSEQTQWQMCNTEFVPISVLYRAAQTTKMVHNLFLPWPKIVNRICLATKQYQCWLITHLRHRIIFCCHYFGSSWLTTEFSRAKFGSWNWFDVWYKSCI